MLVLTRRPGESVKIGDDIEIMIGRVQGDQVKLCFTAPKEISIHRNEIYTAMKEGKSKEERIKGEKLTSSIKGALHE